MWKKLCGLLLTAALLSSCAVSAPSGNVDQAIEGQSIQKNEQKKDGLDQNRSEMPAHSKKGMEARVINVVDGDTVDVVLKNGGKERVRLLLIDTPETKHPRVGVQPFGKEASAYTEKHLSGKEVTLELDVSERDRYGRVLAYVWLDGRNYNELLVEKGLARVAVFPPDVKYVDQFREKQEEARQKGIGIWSIENYATDRGYTQSKPKREEQPAKGGEACAGKIKGNVNSGIYHVPGGRFYDVTTSNIRWFCSETEAEEAGFRKSRQ